MYKANFTRRGVMKTGAAAGAALTLPTYLRADGHAGFTNAPGDSEIVLGFNVPQSGPYADEGADELRAYELAVEHINGGGDGGDATAASLTEATSGGTGGGGAPDPSQCPLPPPKRSF